MRFRSAASTLQAAVLAALLPAVALSQGSGASGAEASKKAAVAMTSDQANAMLAELRQIRELLEKQVAAQAKQPPAGSNAPAPAQNVKLDVTGLPVLGRLDAPLTMLEFTDYQCPYCRAFHNDTFTQIKSQWIDTGKLRFISWDLPLAIHGQATAAALAARCAADQGKFWEMRALLIANAAHLNPDEIVGYAKQIPRVDAETFSACVSNDKYAEKIKASVQQANALGITATPTLVVARSNGNVVDGAVIVGAQPFASFDSRLKSLMEAAR